MNLLHANDRAGEYPPSWYAATATPLPPFPALAGEVRADVVVVGGGYTGLSAALHMAQAGLRVVLLEAHRVGFGASGRNGGQVGSGQRLEVDDLEPMFGRDTTRRLWDFGNEAKDLVKSLIDTHAIDADWTPGIAHAVNRPRDLPHAFALAEKLDRDYAYPHLHPMDAAEFRGWVDSPLYHGGALDRGAASIHPLRYALGLAKAAAGAGAAIHERSEVTRIDHGPKVTVHTAGGRVTADHLCLACNGYLGGLDGHVAARVMPIINFIVATETLGDRAAILRDRIAVADSLFVINYFRVSHDGRLLFGGGESYGYRFPAIEPTVRKPLERVFPQLKGVRIDHAWGGTLAITMNRLPCFARPAPNVLSASGYSGHGVALATLAGRAMAEAVRGQAARFDVLASLPSAPFPGGPKLRAPLLALAMTWFSLRDRLGL